MRRWLATIFGRPEAYKSKISTQSVDNPETNEKKFSVQSIGDQPWKHPFICQWNVEQFRRYSEDIWQIALEYSSRSPAALKCAFSVNMAQSMYKWARMARDRGAIASLFCHPQDESAISRPEWEDFDGEYPNLFDAAGFLAANTNIAVDVPCYTIAMGDSGMLQAWENSLKRGDWNSLHDLLNDTGMYPEAALLYQGFYPYWNWAKALEKQDVIYTCSSPIAAYLSGRPYCFFSVGGDLQFDCGQANDYGMIMRLAVNRARFIFVSNPLTLGHCRRLGFRNAVYLPYPMDSNRYCPGEGVARHEWEMAYGKGVYVLTTSRIDGGVKGHDTGFLDALFSLARLRSQVRFIFLGWGADMEAFRDRINAEGLASQIMILPPVGKKRLIDYYRSCDAVLDQFVYGYYGATALEAASVGKPVVMRLRADQYAPLYDGDVAPVENAHSPEEMHQAILTLVDDEDYRREKGEAMRAWLVRNHGEERTAPLMLALLRLAADREPLPTDLVNPLASPLTDEEIAYHQECLRPVE